jgi:hypothetical protein
MLGWVVPVVGFVLVEAVEESHEAFYLALLPGRRCPVSHRVGQRIGGGWLRAAM